MLVVNDCTVPHHQVALTSLMSTLALCSRGYGYALTSLMSTLALPMTLNRTAHEPYIKSRCLDSGLARGPCRCRTGGKVSSTTGETGLRLVELSPKASQACGWGLGEVQGRPSVELGLAFETHLAHHGIMLCRNLILKQEGKAPSDQHSSRYRYCM